MSTGPPALPRDDLAAGPLPPGAAWLAVGRCVGESARMLSTGAVSWPHTNIGRGLRFADGTTGRVYRETVVARPVAEPCFLVVSFRLRLVRGRGHAWFRGESWLNTPLFVGFPGFVSKLWLAHDEQARYRGVYEWDGSARAEDYARSLWRVLALVSERGSIDYRVVPGLSRDEALADHSVLRRDTGAFIDDWWRPVGTA